MTFASTCRHCGATSIFDNGEQAERDPLCSTCHSVRDAFNSTLLDGIESRAIIEVLTQPARTIPIHELPAHLWSNTGGGEIPQAGQDY